MGCPAGCQLNRRLQAGPLLDYMRRDKKNRDGRLRFVLVRGIGKAFTSEDLAGDEVLEFLLDEGYDA